MLPTYIRLKGFKGIKHGLGLDEIELDLSGLKGLIALTGENGAGKTTLLEQMQFFPQVISRPQSAIKNHVFLRDSEREQRFFYNDKNYRTLVKADAMTGRAEGFLWENDAPLVKGKLTDYVAAGKELFGTPDMVFASIFAAQSAKKFTDVDPADFKKLMAEFLRLDRYFGWEATSKEAEKRLARAILAIDRDLIWSQEKLDSLGDPKARILTLKDSLDRAIEDRAGLDQIIRATRSQIEEARAVQTENNRLRQVVSAGKTMATGLSEEIYRLEGENHTAISEAESAVTAAKSNVAAISQTLSQADAVEVAKAQKAKNDRLRQVMAAEASKISAIESGLEPKSLRHSETQDEALRAVNRAITNTQSILHKLVGADGVEQAEKDLQSAKTALVEIERNRDRAIADLTAIDQTKADASEKAAEALKLLNADLEGLREKHAQATKTLADLQRAESETMNGFAALDAAPELARLDAEINSLRRQAADLERRGVVIFKPAPDTLASKLGPQPFKCNSTDCAFIRSALDAEKALPGKLSTREAEARRIETEGDALRLRQIATAEEIRAAKAALETVTSDGRAMKAKIQDTETRQNAEMDQLLIQRTAAKKTGDQFAEHLATQRGVVAELETKAARIGEVKAAKEQLPIAQQVESQTRGRLAEIEAEWAKTFKDAAETIAEAKARIAAAVAGIDTEADTLAAVESDIKTAREQLPVANDVLLQANSRLSALMAHCTAVIQEKTRALSEANARIVEAESKINHTADAEVASLETTLSGLEADFESASESLASLRANIARAEAAAAMAVEIAQEIDALNARRANLVHHASTWAFLTATTGANGLRANEIDAVAPTISGYANDLLIAADGPAGHVIGLRTLDENGKEVLEPVVTRPDGTTEIIKQFSGGEKTWDLKALRLALTIVAKHKSRKNFLAAFADEEDGALSVRAAKAFVRMYREFMRMGGFEALYFISHKLECVAMADARIVFNGGVHIE
ncbi:MAG: hypothetical protein ABIL58_23460 [Pseudomonadota bacterium]